MRLCHRRSFRTETPLGHLIVAISHTSIERILEVSVLGVHQTFEVGILDLQAGPLLVRIIKLVGHAPAFQLVLLVSVLNLLDGLDHAFPLCLCHLSVAAWQVILLLHFKDYPCRCDSCGTRHLQNDCVPARITFLLPPLHIHSCILFSTEVYVYHSCHFGLKYTRCT